MGGTISTTTRTETVTCQVEPGSPMAIHLATGLELSEPERIMALS